MPVRRRLQQFGKLGAWLNQAIDEANAFHQQQHIECAAQAAAVARLREPAEPGKGELATHVPHLRNMAERFPTWIVVIASTERLAQWFALERHLPMWRKRLYSNTRTSESPSRGGTNWWGVGLAVFILLSLLARCGSGSAP